MTSKPEGIRIISLIVSIKKEDLCQEREFSKADHVL